jgi:hypothetical protein
MSKELATVGREAPQIIKDFQDIAKVAEAISKSQVFGLTEPQAITLMMLALDNGITPMQAFTRYHLIPQRNGGTKPSLSAAAMLSNFQQAGGSVKWHTDLGDGKTQSATFTHPKYAPEGVKCTITFDQMKASGVCMGKDGVKENWRKFPDAMLRARVISKAIRAIAPGLAEGLYTPEELADSDMPVTSVDPPVSAPDRAHIPDAEIIEDKPKEKPAGKKSTYEEILASLKKAHDLETIAAVEEISLGYKWQEATQIKLAEAFDDAKLRVEATTMEQASAPQEPVYGQPSEDDELGGRL